MHRDAAKPEGVPGPTAGKPKKFAVGEEQRQWRVLFGKTPVVCLHYNMIMTTSPHSWEKHFTSIDKAIQFAARVKRIRAKMLKEEPKVKQPGVFLDERRVTRLG